MNWNDISLNQFNELKDILLDNEIEEEDRLLFEVQIIFKVNPYKLSVPELQKYLKELRFMGQDIPKMKVSDLYVLGKTTYRLNKRLENFTVAQWIDFQHFLTEGGADTDNYHKILSVFFFPLGKEDYNEGYDIKKVQSDIGEYLSIPDAMAISGFFLTYRKVLLIRSLLYIRNKTLRTATPLKRKERRKIRKEYRKAIWKIITTTGV